MARDFDGKIPTLRDLLQKAERADDSIEAALAAVKPRPHYQMEDHDELEVIVQTRRGNIPILIMPLNPGDTLQWQTPFDGLIVKDGMILGITVTTFFQPLDGGPRVIGSKVSSNT